MLCEKQEVNKEDVFSVVDGSEEKELCFVWHGARNQLEGDFWSQVSHTPDLGLTASKRSASCSNTVVHNIVRLSFLLAQKERSWFDT